MNLLFFDIECANCFNGSGKICEFGYILTDENFNEIEQDIFVINPKTVFDRYVEKNMLAYSTKEYYSSPTYTHYFKKISQLFNLDDLMVIGHTVDADASYLNHESKRFKLPFLNYTFYDAKIIYSEFANATSGIGLEQIGKDLGSPLPTHAHRSLDDAIATMYTVKEMCNKMNTSITELIKLCPSCVGKTNDGEITTVVREEARKKREEAINQMILDNKITLKTNKHYICFLKKLRINKNSNSILCGKKIAFCKEFEESNLRRTVYLNKVMAKMGASRSGHSSEADYFVKVPHKKPNAECKRLKAAIESNNDGGNVQIIELDELLELLNISCLQEEKFPQLSANMFNK